jgi:putative aldouronate transport system substrate-binding protein
MLPVLAFAGGRQSAPAAGSTQASSSERQPVTITYFFAMHPDVKAESFTDNERSLVQLREKTGVTIRWQLSPDALWDEAYNLLMASGDIPDVVMAQAEMIKRYPRAWVSVDTIIKGNTARYPNLNKYIFESDYLTKYMPDTDGHVRYIPMLATRRIGNMIMARQDLLSRYGLQAPVTLDDWHTLLTRAKQDGLVPYMTRGGRDGLLFLIQGYLDCVGEDYFAEDGKIKYGVLDPRFKEGIEILRQWYAEGLIDPEYPSTDSTRWWEGVVRGEVFSTHDNIARVGAANEEFVNQNVPYRMEGIGPMQSPRTGARHTNVHYPTVRANNIAISINTRNPDRILDMFEYCFSDEGNLLMNYGIENYSFTYVNGVPLADPDYARKLSSGEIREVITLLDMPKRQRDELYTDYTLNREDHASVRAARDLYANNDFIVENWIGSLVFTNDEQAALAPLVADLDTYRSEMLDKFIMGIEPMSRWDAFVSQIQRMNLQRTIDIHQAALDRLLK